MNRGMFTRRRGASRVLAPLDGGRGSGKGKCRLLKPRRCVAGSTLLGGAGEVRALLGWRRADWGKSSKCGNGGCGWFADPRKTFVKVFDLVSCFSCSRSVEGIP